MSYKNLEIWQLAKEVSNEIHKITLDLPKFEHYEEGSQIRRSSKSVRSNIVEGYGRRAYKNDFVRFLTYALASNDETMDHLEILYETKSLNNKQTYNDMHVKIEMLGKKTNRFLSSVISSHKSEK